LYSVNGGEGVEIIGRSVRGADVRSVFGGRGFCFSRSSTGGRPGRGSGLRRRHARGQADQASRTGRTGRILENHLGRNRPSSYQGRQRAAAIAARKKASPDGRWLGVSAPPDSGPATISYKGRTSGSTAPPSGSASLHSRGKTRRGWASNEVTCRRLKSPRARPCPGMWAGGTAASSSPRGGIAAPRLDVATGKRDDDRLHATACTERLRDGYGGPLDISDGPVPESSFTLGDGSPGWGRPPRLSSRGGACGKWICLGRGDRRPGETARFVEPLEMVAAWSPGRTLDLSFSRAGTTGAFLARSGLSRRTGGARQPTTTEAGRVSQSGSGAGRGKQIS